MRRGTHNNNYFSRIFLIRRLYSPEMLTRTPRFHALCNQYRCTVGSTVITAIVDKEGGGSKDIGNRLHKAHGAFQRLWKKWADTPIQDFSPTNHAIWLQNVEDYKGQQQKSGQFPMPMPQTDTEDWTAGGNGKRKSG